MAAHERLMTVDEFEDFIVQPENVDRLFELINGEIVEKMPTRENGVVALNIGTEFNIYLRQNLTGLAAVEARHRPEDSTSDVRLPDVSIVLGDKPVETRGATPYMPDVVVEVQPPDDSWRKMFERALFYLDHGTRMVILVFPRSRQVEVLTADTRLVLNEDDTLEGGDGLPGFKMAVKDIFWGV
jgi:Uma2 family endonuclease